MSITVSLQNEWEKTLFQHAQQSRSASAVLHKTCCVQEVPLVHRMTKITRAVCNM